MTKLSYILKTIKIGRDTIHIYAYHQKSAKIVSFKTEDKRKIEGNFSFANRVTSGNSNVTHDQQGFDSAQMALKNLKSLKKQLAKWEM